MHMRALLCRGVARVDSDHQAICTATFRAVSRSIASRPIADVQQLWTLQEGIHFILMSTRCHPFSIGLVVYIKCWQMDSLNQYRLCTMCTGGFVCSV